MIDFSYPFVEVFVEADVRAVGAEERDGLLHYCVELRSLVGFRYIEEHALNLAEDFSGEFERSNSVLESRGLRVAHNCRDFLVLLLYSLLYCRNVVLSLDFVKRRNSVRGVPFGKERIGLAGGKHQ